MPSATRDNKSERLVARVSAQDKAAIERAAALEGRSMSAFVVQHLRAVAREVIEAESVIRLTEEESRRFIKILNSPPRKPTAAFKRALTDYQETVISDVNQPAK